MANPLFSSCGLADVIRCPRPERKALIERIVAFAGSRQGLLFFNAEDHLVVISNGRWRSIDMVPDAVGDDYELIRHEDPTFFRGLHQLSSNRLLA
jgi:hypothetical protein